eukprot:TRINITY_DN1985_c0_g2_i1.p1 TRINITY_DN1985_c0_g2~~TRINITY_DN1985_c0_g2_i1.p1  ORF type:complete len:339 (-),score=111.36 TRINITY_DN1985_c0_g2_i1:756-1772(-)
MNGREESCMHDEASVQWCGTVKELICRKCEHTKAQHQHVPFPDIKLMLAARLDQNFVDIKKTYESIQFAQRTKLTKADNFVSALAQQIFVVRKRLKGKFPSEEDLKMNKAIMMGNLEKNEKLSRYVKGNDMRIKVSIKAFENMIKFERSNAEILRGYIENDEELNAILSLCDAWNYFNGKYKRFAQELGLMMYKNAHEVSDEEVLDGLFDHNIEVNANDFDAVTISTKDPLPEEDKHCAKANGLAGMNIKSIREKLEKVRSSLNALIEGARTQFSEKFGRAENIFNSIAKDINARIHATGKEEGKMGMLKSLNNMNIVVPLIARPSLIKNDGVSCKFA